MGIDHRRETMELLQGRRPVGGSDTDPGAPAGHQPTRRRTHVATPTRRNREVEAYALRWDVAIRGALADGSAAPAYYRVRADALNDWLASSERPAVIADHDDQVGTFTEFTVDDIGLRTVAVYDDTDRAADVLDDIESGKVTAYSVHLIALETGDTGETREGLPVVDVLVAELGEAGPTDQPADPGAVIVSLSGQHLRDAAPAGPEPATVTDALAYLESVSGQRITVEDVDRHHSRIRQAAAADVDAIERLASRLAKTRRSAQTHWLNTRAPWRHPDDTRRYIELDREAAELEEVLRDAVCNDAELLAQLYTRYNILPAVTPMQRLVSLARNSRRGKPSMVA
jgi:phage head maturation protease